jgi:hypothetical protein
LKIILYLRPQGQGLLDLFFFVEAASLLVFLITATTRRRDEKCASHTFSSFYVAHLAQPNESSRRRAVAVIKKRLGAAQSETILS